MLSEDLIALAMERMRPYACEGFVRGRGPRGADLMFVGEAPGKTELEVGKPFTGQAGKVFSGYLDRLGVTREEVFITSAVRSRPYKIIEKVVDGKKVIKNYNRTPNKKEILAHAPILDEEIRQVQPKILIPMGKTAVWRLTGWNTSMQEITGRLFETSIMELESLDQKTYRPTKEKYSVFPIYHPAAILYARRLEAKAYQDIDQLKQLKDSI
ncbi:uracil-DNA glycosylase [Virgibacillus senegalensis]|uniref:uracil-DNA glycosylase n=1 Tax=Virgibacillus senegalensis TaxID=1499679 RepID=UPI00069D2A08|nr:uracil-DNA glycosylase [Virgibacillus senegalensis]